MSFGALLEQGIEANGRVVWVVNNFKGSELKYESYSECSSRTSCDVVKFAMRYFITLVITLDIFCDTH